MVDLPPEEAVGFREKCIKAKYTLILPYLCPTPNSKTLVCPTCLLLRRPRLFLGYNSFPQLLIPLYMSFPKYDLSSSSMPLLTRDIFLDGHDGVFG